MSAVGEGLLWVALGFPSPGITGVPVFVPASPASQLLEGRSLPQVPRRHERPGGDDPEPDQLGL